jgi:thioredoxin reductase
VVVGVGVQPRTQLEAGIGVENGILVDEHLQTDAPGVFPAGDTSGTSPSPSNGSSASAWQSMTAASPIRRSAGEAR